MERVGMKRAAVWLLTGGMAAAFVLAALLTQTWYFKPLKLEWFYLRAFTSYALNSPEMMSAMRLLPSWADFYSTRLDDASPAHSRAVMQELKGDLDTLESFDRNDLDRKSRISYDTLRQYLQLEIQGEPFQFYDFPVNQVHGLHTALPEFMADVHQVTSKREAEAYITRLQKFPRKFEQLVELMQKQEDIGVLPPHFMIERVLQQLQVFAGRPARQNTLYTSFAARLDNIPLAEMNEATRKDLLTQVADAIRTSVYPAYVTLIRHMQDIEPRIQGNRGVWALPNGEAYYAWCVRRHTTTNLTPQRIHELGLGEVVRVSEEMDKILHTHGMTEGSIGERMAKLSADPAQHYPDTAEGRKAMMADYERIVSEGYKRLPTAFGVLPKLRVEVRPVPEAIQSGGLGGYYIPGAFDGSRPGVFYVNLGSVSEVPKYTMRTSAFHEAVPGHHLQIQLAQEMEGVPIFLKVISFSAFQEGWAQYAEHLAGEMGLEPEPVDQLGRLRDEMTRAVRLVVDTGLHYKRWTREQAIAYMMDTTGLSRQEATTEVERYMVYPGQALAYKVGMLTILSLRERAKAELGDRFDLRQFHNEVLTHGALPLTVLERVVNDWIAQRKAGR
jgi:uncharacterized protein (DUF885 family)